MKATEKITFKPEPHICREAGYSPLKKACMACLYQLSKNSAERDKKRRK